MTTPLCRDLRLGRAIFDGEGNYRADRMNSVPLILLDQILKGINLLGTDLSGVDFNGADLQEALLKEPGSCMAAPSTPAPRAAAAQWTMALARGRAPS